MNVISAVLYFKRDLKIGQKKRVSFLCLWTILNKSRVEYQVEFISNIVVVSHNSSDNLLLLAFKFNHNFTFQLM